MPRNTISSFDIVPSSNRPQNAGAAKPSIKAPVGNTSIPSQLPNYRQRRPAAQPQMEQFKQRTRPVYNYHRPEPVLRKTVQPAPTTISYGSAPAKKQSKATIFAAIMIIAVGFIGIKTFMSPSEVPADSIASKVGGSEIANEVQAEQIVETVPTVDADAVLGPLVDGLVKKNPGMDIGVAAVDMQTGKQYIYGLDTGFLAASTPKLITAAAYYHDVEQGKRSLDTSIGGVKAGALIKSMITVSDNDAWARLNKVLTIKGLKSYSNANGFSGYNPVTNTINPKDIATMLQKLYSEDLLNETNSTELLGYMKQANYTNYIPAAVPEGVSVYHKAGWLDDRVHDAAIIDDGTNSFVLVIFTKMKGGYNSTAGLDVFHQITKASINLFLTRS